VIPPRAHNPTILKSAVDDPRAIASHVASKEWLAGATLLKEDARTSVFAGESSEGPVVVKTMRLDRVKDRLSAIVGRTRLMRQWAGWELLMKAGIASPGCFVLFRSKGVETLVMRRVEGETLLDRIAAGTPTPRERTPLADALAGMLNAMRDASVFNRDNKPSNIVIERGTGTLWLVDTVGSVDECLPLVWSLATDGDHGIVRRPLEQIGRAHV